MRWLTGIVTGLTLLVAGLSGEGYAQEGAAPGVGDLTEPPESALWWFDMGLGWAQIAEDHYIDTVIGFSLAVSKLEMSIGVPLRFRVIDNSPEDEGVIRREDWDEPSEYLRVLRFVQWGSRREPAYVRAGELINVTMGHGTILDGYSNIIDVNHYKWGIEAAVHQTWGGAELMLNNLLAPNVLGVRTYLRPWAFVDPSSYFYNLAFGLSLVGDFNAPVELARMPDGSYVFDDERNFVVDQAESTWVMGIDAELEAFTNETVTVVPYTDVNFHFSHGTGFYLGTLLNFTFTESFQANTRLEFRALGQGFEPVYFNRLYEVERYQFRPLDPTGQLRPKLQVVSLEPQPSRIGWYGELTLAFLRAIYLTAGYEDYEGPFNAGFWARLAIPQLGPVRVGGYLANRNFDGAGGIFDLDTLLLVTEARVNFAGPFYLIGQYSRRWSATEAGTYLPVDDWGVGVGMSFGF